MMRKISYLVLLLILPFIGFGQNNSIKGKTLKIAQKSKLIGQVVVGGSSFDQSAILELIASDKGVLITRMNTSSRDDIDSPATGLLIYNTQTTQFEFFDATWQPVGGGGHDAVTLSGTPDYITLSGQDIVRGLIDLSTDITGTTTATSISDFDTEVSNNASVTANTAKVTNVTTNLSEGTTTNTTVDVNSSDGSNATLAAASASRAGVMTKAKFDEVVINNAKVTNATHTSEVTGSGALNLDKIAITNKTSVTAAATDEILISDASDGGNLKRVTAQSIADLGGGGGDGIYDGGGSLTANPTTVTQGSNKLKFTSTVIDGFSVDGTTFSVDANNNRVGIGTIAPTNLVTLHAASGDGLYLKNTSGNTQASLVTSTSGARFRLQNGDGTLEKIALGTSTDHISSKAGSGITNFGFGITTVEIIGGLNKTVQIVDETGVNKVGIRIGVTSQASLAIWTNQNTNVAFGTTTNHNLRIFTNSLERAVFSASGDLVVGFSTPSARLNVRGVNSAPTSDALLIEDNVGTDLFTIQNDGRVGIGTSGAIGRLFHVTGDLSGSAVVQITNTNSSTGSGLLVTTANVSSSRQLLILTSSSVTKMIVLNSGDVAIGTGFGSPTAKLHIQGINTAGTSDALRVDDSGGGQLLLIENGGDIMIGNGDPTEKLQINGNAIIGGNLSTTVTSPTLGVGVTSFVVSSNVMTLTGDVGSNTIATITGANSGMVLNLIFVDGLITITDDNTHSANSVDLSAAFTSVDDTTLQIVFDGTSWYEISRSTN